MFNRKFYTIATMVLAAMHTSWLHAQDYTPSAAPAIKTFSVQGDITGAASNSVNLHTGDVSLPLDLVSLQGHNGSDVSIAITYNSNVQHEVNKWNLESNTGILGLGWSMDIPKILSDNKQTGTREDDDYYIIENGSTNKLVRTTSGTDGEGSFYSYEASNYQFWKIKFYYDPAEMGTSGSGSNKWVITKEDGRKYVFGDKNSNRSTIQWVVRWGNWMGNSSQSTGQSQLANIWNLSEIVNVWNEKTIFEYENVDQYVGSYSGKMQTEASYVKTITDVWGRKLSFVYKDKQIPYYMEPHTEKAEPDAYQEFYEKKYLDRIDMLVSTNNKLFSIQFNYTYLNYATDAVKMLLASIVQKNADGNSLPGMKFSYYSSGATKGFLNSVTYPSGGIVSYAYTEKTPGHSNRELAINAPAGYAEPKVWLGEDYAVVAWRQLGSGSSHDDNARDVKLYVYQWVGEWKEQFLQTIGQVGLIGDNNTKDYNGFQVAVERDFFAVLSKHATTNYNSLFILFKDKNNRGSWLNHTETHDYGNGLPTLMSGSNFLAVGGYRDESGYPSRLYTFLGNSWKTDVFDQTTGLHHYTGANNYFISHNRQVNLNPFLGQEEFNFTFLTEDKKWVTRLWPDALEFNAGATSFWHSSNSMAIAMANDNPEYAYRWDLTYSNFYKDIKDKNNNDLFGQLPDEGSVFIVNNSLVGSNGRLARFDGLSWTAESITSTSNSPVGQYIAYGDDFVVRPTFYASSTGNYRGARKVFNPNTTSFEADVNMDGADRGLDFALAGIDYYYYGNGFYYRQPNGAWVKKHTYSSYNNMWAKSGWPRYNVFHGTNPHNVIETRTFTNGEISPAISLSGRNLLYIPYKFRNTGVGGETIVTFPSWVSSGENATTIYLNRMVNDQLAGTQKDYPVTLMSIYDNITTRYIMFDYNVTTAVVDPSGTMAAYNEVTEIHGTTSASTRPYGYSKVYFYNGLTAAEMGVDYIPVQQMWSGLVYKREVYDKNNVLKQVDKTTYQTFNKTLQNNVGTNVLVAYWVRPTEVRSTVDNIESATTTAYNENTGQPSYSWSLNFDSKNNDKRVDYKYFWELYDPTRSLNLLTPVAQVKESVYSGGVQIFSDVMATTYKTWNNVYAPHKTYVWKRTGSSDFNFTSWSGTGEPSADWYKTGDIISMSNTGDVLHINNY